MKKFSIFKFGYSSGVYGLSGVYFHLVVLNGNSTYSCHFQGIYTEGHEIARFLKDNDFQEFYVYIPYTKLTKKDIKPSQIKNENQVLTELKEFLEL